MNMIAGYMRMLNNKKLYNILIQRNNSIQMSKNIGIDSSEANSLTKT